MAERATPVQVAKELNIRPQIIYGLIKRGKIKTFDNPSGKADLVDIQETRMIVGRMHVRGPRKEKAAKTGRSPVRRGQILSRDKFPSRGVMSRPFGGGRSVIQVTDPGRGEGTLVWGTDTSGREQFWDTESLAMRLKRGEVKLEHTGALLGMIAFQWREEGNTEHADQLEEWCRERGIITVPLKDEEHEHDDQEGEVVVDSEAK